MQSVIIRNIVRKWPTFMCHYCPLLDGIRTTWLCHRPLKTILHQVSLLAKEAGVCSLGAGGSELYLKCHYKAPRGYCMKPSESCGVLSGYRFLLLLLNYSWFIYFRILSNRPSYCYPFMFVADWSSWYYKPTWLPSVSSLFNSDSVVSVWF